MGGEAEILTIGKNIGLDIEWDTEKYSNFNGMNIEVYSIGVYRGIRSKNKGNPIVKIISKLLSNRFQVAFKSLCFLCK
jgi:hypothetical protein